MATTRASGYVVTHTVWNDVLSRLTDDGITFSGNVNGGSIAGTTGSFSSTLAVTGAATLSSTLSVSGNGAFNSGGTASSTFLAPSTSAIAVRVIGRSSDDTAKVDFTNGTQSTAYLTVTTASTGITFAADGSSRPFTFSGAQIRIPDGSAATPALSGTDTDTGLYFSTGAVLVATDGVLRYSFGAAGMSLPALDLNTAAGRGISIGRNNDGAFPAAGYLSLENNAGTAYYLWVDATGDLRIHTAPPNQADSVSDTAGTVVGTQS